MADNDTLPKRLDEAADASMVHAADESGLQASLRSLSTLATGHLDLAEHLTEVAWFAVRAVPGAEGAGLTLLGGNGVSAFYTTASFIHEVDEIQHGLGKGPCFTAVAQRSRVVSPSLGADSRWPRFGGRVARLGVHSALSLPLITPQRLVGAINVYSRAKNAFDAHAADMGEQFAVPAAIAVQNAQVLARAERLASQLQDALTTQGAVDRAVGIMMSRSGNTAEEALHRLRTLSQQEHRKLGLIADSIIAEAVRRARARKMTAPD